MGESVHQLLEVMFCVCSDGCIVCKEHFSYGGFEDLGLCSESWDVVQLAMRREKKMPKGIGARTQPCFTPLLMLKGSDMLPSY